MMEFVESRLFCRIDEDDRRSVNKPASGNRPIFRILYGRIDAARSHPALAA